MSGGASAWYESMLSQTFLIQNWGIIQIADDGGDCFRGESPFSPPFSASSV